MSWDAPVADPDEDNIEYEIRLEPVDPSNERGLTLSDLTSTTGTVTTLEIGVPYTVKVKAFYSDGYTTDYVEADSTLTAYGPSDPPTNVVAYGQDSQAIVQWNVPAFDGDSSITGYEVTSNPSGLTCTTTTTSCIITGLSNGTSYTFTVTAENAAGLSDSSTASNQVTPTAAGFTVVELSLIHISEPTRPY